MCLNLYSFIEIATIFLFGIIIPCIQPLLNLIPRPPRLERDSCQILPLVDVAQHVLHSPQGASVLHIDVAAKLLQEVGVVGDNPLTGVGKLPLLYCPPIIGSPVDWIP